jgi:hypothetical protein
MMMSIRAGIIALGVGILCVIGWLIYGWYETRENQAAYQDLLEAVDGFQVAALSKAPDRTWQDLERLFSRGAQSHKHSSLYPYFVLYNAEVLLHQDKAEQALPLFDSALARLKKHDLFGAQAHIKRALIKLDMADQALKTQGEKELEELIADLKNPVRDMALYHSGYRFWLQGDVKQAEQRWKMLAAQFPQSPWTTMAQQIFVFNAA